MSQLRSLENRARRVMLSTILPTSEGKGGETRFIINDVAEAVDVNRPLPARQKKKKRPPLK